MSVSEPRLLHVAGRCGLVLPPDDSNLISSGDDSSIRFSNADSGDNLVEITKHFSGVPGLAVSSASSKGLLLVSGDRDGNLNVFSLPDRKPISSAKFNGTVHSIACHPRDEVFAVSGEERDGYHVKLYSFSSAAPIAKVKSHANPVVKLAYSCNGYLASVDSEGLLLVHQVEPMGNFEKFRLETGVKTIWNESNTNIGLEFHPTEKMLAVSKGNDVEIYSFRGSWTLESTLRGVHSDSVVQLAFSRNGRYIITNGLDKRTLVWDVASHEMITEAPAELQKVLVAVVWYHKENSAAAIDEDGNLIKWKGPVPESMEKPFREAKETNSASVASSPAKASNKRTSDGERKEKRSAEADQEMAEEKESKSEKIDNIFDDESGDELPAPPKETARDGADSASGDRSAGRKRLKKLRERDSDADSDEEAEEEEDIDDFIEDDTNGAYKDSTTDKIARKSLGLKKSKFGNFLIQSAFQPGSTPFENQSCFLHWNSVGTIVSMKVSRHKNKVEISFSDAGKQKINFTDLFNFRMAALGVNGAVFASTTEKNYIVGADGVERQDPNNPLRPSAVLYRSFHNWSAQQQTVTFTLPMGENAACVAVTYHFMAVATDKLQVRILSYGGVQKTILSLPGPIVTMVGSEKSDALAIVHYNGVQLNTMIYDLETRSLIYNGPLSISPDSALTWINFAENGALLTMDSAGIVRGLSRRWQAWQPLLDTSRLKTGNSKHDHYWPVGMIENQLMCAICKGGATYPVNKPVLSAVPLQMPFVVVSDPQSAQLEEVHARNEFFLLEQHSTNQLASQTAMGLANILGFTRGEQAQQDKALIPIMHRAVKAKHSSTALDICSQLFLMESLNIAKKLALTEKDQILASRIELLIKARSAQEKANRAISIDELMAGEQLTNVGRNRLMKVRVVGEDDAAEEVHRPAAQKPAVPASRNRGSRWAELEEEAEKPTASTAPAAKDDDDGEAEFGAAKAAPKKKGMRQEESDEEDKENERRRKAKGLLEKPARRNTADNLGAKSTPVTSAAAATEKFNPFLNKGPAAAASSKPAAAAPVAPTNPFAKK